MNTKENPYSFLLPHSYQRAEFGGIAASPGLICFVGLHNHTVSALRFFTAEDGSGLETDYLASEHVKCMTTYRTGIGSVLGGSFNMARAVQDFKTECGLERICFDPDAIPASLVGDVGLPIETRDSALVDAAAWLRGNLITRFTSGYDPRMGVLKYYLRSLPPATEFNAGNLDKMEPILATLYALVAAGYVRTDAQKQASEKLIADAAHRQAERVREQKRLDAQREKQRLAHEAWLASPEGIATVRAAEAAAAQDAADEAERKRIAFEKASKEEQEAIARGEAARRAHRTDRR